MKRIYAVLSLLLFAQAAFADGFTPAPATYRTVQPFPHPLPAVASSVIPSRHLKAFRRALDAGAAVVVVAGDSTGTANQNNAVAPTENLYDKLRTKLLADNWGAVQQGATITTYDRSVAGQTWGTLAGAIGYTATTTGASSQAGGNTTIPVVVPAGVSVGWSAFGTGLATGVTTAIPITAIAGDNSSFTVAGSYTVAGSVTITFQPPNTPSWYTAPAQPWLTTTAYIPTLAPDLIVIPMGTNDSSGIGGEKIKTVLNDFCNTTNYPKQPDVIFVINSGHAGSSSTNGELQASALARTIARSGANGLGLSCNIDVGYIDLGRFDTIARLGVDPASGYMQQQQSNVTGITTFPYTFATSPNGDFDLQMQFVGGSSGMFPTGASWDLLLGSTVGNGTETARLNFFANSTLFGTTFFNVGTGSLSGTNVTIGTGDIYLNVTVKPSTGRILVTARTQQAGVYVTTTILDTLESMPAGQATPVFQVRAGSPTATMTIASYSTGTGMPREIASPDASTWGNDGVYCGASVPGYGGGNQINHVCSFGAATLIDNALSAVRLGAHDGALIPLQQLAATAAGTTQGTALAITGDLVTISSCPSGTAGLVLPKQVIPGDRVFHVINNDPSNACNIYPNTSAAINGGTTNAAVTIAANGGSEYFEATGTAGTAWVKW